MPSYALPPGASWYPQYLPYPEAIPSVSDYPVPNATAVNWPQAQFAPATLPPGSRSFQPFNSATGATTKVLYGQGNPFDTQTPLDSEGYGGTDLGCGCGGGSYAGDDEGDELWSPWAYLLLGAGIALVMQKVIAHGRNEPDPYEDDY